MNKNVEESRKVAKHPKVQVTQQKCYRNAFRVIQYVPGYEDAAYVEGVAVRRNGLSIEHGWVEFDGEIIDPTLPDDEMAYFPGLRFPGQVGISEALRIPKHFKGDSDLPIFYRFGWGGCESPEFCQAWDDAWGYLVTTGYLREDNRPPSMVEQLMARPSVN
jgi:hypothetical protein